MNPEQAAADALFWAKRREAWRARADDPNRPEKAGGPFWQGLSRRQCLYHARKCEGFIVDIAIRLEHTPCPPKP